MRRERSSERPVTRRQIVAVAAALTAGTAGCLGPLGGSDDSGESEKGSGAADETTPEPEQTEEETPTPAPEEESSLGEQPLLPDSFAMEASIPVVGFGEPGELTGFSGRVYNGDIFVSVAAESEPEWYFVDGQGYFVGEDHEGERECVLDTEDDVEREEEISPFAFEDEAAENADAEPAVREVEDGETLVNYEIAGDDAVHYDDTLVLSVSEETGYLRHVDAPSATWEFHSFGEVEPVEAPEMECIALEE